MRWLGSVQARVLDWRGVHVRANSERRTGGKPQTKTPALAAKWRYLQVQPHWDIDKRKFTYLVNNRIDPDLGVQMSACEYAHDCINVLGLQGWELATIKILDLTDEERRMARSDPAEWRDRREWIFYFKQPVIEELA
jgi:hypothetical protein